MTDIWRFCIYCQKEYASAENLYRHIIRYHKNTYAYWRVVPADFREQHDI